MDPMIHYSEELGHHLFLVQILTNSLSVFGSLFIVLMHVFFKDLRSFAYKLVMLLALADILFGVGRMFTFEDYFQNDHSPELDYACYAQAYLTTFGGLSTITATMAISWSLTQSVIQGVTDLDAYSKWYYFAIFVIPALLSIIPGVSGVYGVSGFSCWIEDNGTQSQITVFIWILCFFYIPLWLSVIYNFVNYIRIWKFVKDIFAKEGHSDEETAQKQLLIIKKLTLYPLIMVVCYLFATTNIIYSIFDKNLIPSLCYLQVGFSGIQGILNSVVYGFNKQVKKKIFSFCICCKDHENSQNPNELSLQIKQKFDYRQGQESRELPSRNESSSSSIESTITNENGEELTDSQKQIRERLGQDLFLNYNSRPREQIFEAKMNTLNRNSSLSEYSQARTETENKNQRHDIN